MIFLLLFFALVVLLGFVLRKSLENDRPHAGDIVEQLLGYRRAQAMSLQAPPEPIGKPVWLEPTQALRKQRGRQTLWWRYAPVWGSAMMATVILATYWLASMPGHPALVAALALLASLMTVDALRASRQAVESAQFTLCVDGSSVLLRDAQANTHRYCAKESLFDGKNLLLGQHPIPLLRKASFEEIIEHGGSKEPLFERQAFIDKFLPVLTNGAKLASDLQMREQLLRQQNRLWLTRAICVVPGITWLLMLWTAST